MNCIQQLMHPGYQPDCLEGFADSCLFLPAGLYRTETIELSHAKVDSINYTTKENCQAFFCRSFSEVSTQDCEATSCFFGALIYSLGALLTCPCLITGLTMKKIALEVNPKAKAYGDHIAFCLKKENALRELKSLYRKRESLNEILDIAQIVANAKLKAILTEGTPLAGDGNQVDLLATKKKMLEVEIKALELFLESKKESVV